MSFSVGRVFSAIAFCMAGFVGETAWEFPALIAGESAHAQVVERAAQPAVPVALRSTVVVAAAPAWEFGNLAAGPPTWSFNLTDLSVGLPAWDFSSLKSKAGPCGCETGGECTCAECRCCNETDYAAAYATAMRTQQSIYLLVGQDEAVKKEYRRRAAVDGFLFVAVGSANDAPRQPVGIHQFRPPDQVAAGPIQFSPSPLVVANDGVCPGGVCSTPN